MSIVSRPSNASFAIEHAGIVCALVFDEERATAESAIDRCAADHHGNVHPALVELLHAQWHLLRRRDEKRAEPDRIGADFDCLVEDRVDRDLFAEVEDSVAVVGEDRVDE
jgi:hypothetical protein